MSTPPLPYLARRSAPVQRVGRLARWKLTEPARLYGYAVLLGLAAVAVAAGLVSQELAESLSMLAAVVLGVVPAVEAIRASVYSPARYRQDLGLVEAGVSPDVVAVSRAEGLL